ncbi:MAG: DUF2017 family protein [Planctomycetes bacterium]|jgi:hypothetical protein|nr:DUF2017 family protein [Planctomycetota bacterium]
MWWLRVAEGFAFGGLDAVTLETLKGVPMLLESSDVRVRERLLPETCDDAEDEAEWRRHSVPELERLFLSRAQLVRRDLAGIRKLANFDAHVMLIPDGHTNAWLASLNAARLALFVLNDLTAEHMEAEGYAKATTLQQSAVLRIHLLAEIQSVLLGDLEVEDPGVSFEDFILE